MKAGTNGNRARWIMWGAGIVVTGGFALVLGWATAVWGQVDTNREDIAEVRTEQAVLGTKMDYVHQAIGRIEKKLGTAP